MTKHNKSYLVKKTLKEIKQQMKKLMLCKNKYQHYLMYEVYASELETTLLTFENR